MQPHSNHAARPRAETSWLKTLRSQKNFPPVVRHGSPFSNIRHAKPVRAEVNVDTDMEFS